MAGVFALDNQIEIIPAANDATEQATPLSDAAKPWLIRALGLIARADDNNNPQHNRYWTRPCENRRLWQRLFVSGWLEKKKMITFAELLM